MISGVSSRPSIAPSMLLHDFNGKKAKIIQTCKQIDEGNTGVIKVPILQNLLNCLDVAISPADMSACLNRLGLTFEGVQFVKYEPMIRSLQYDNHGECWTFKNSVLANLAGNGASTLRASPDKLSLKYKKERILSTGALRDFDRVTDTLGPDEESHEVRTKKSQLPGQRAVSLKRKLDQQSTRSKSTTFTELVLNKARRNQKNATSTIAPGKRVNDLVARDISGQSRLADKGKEIRAQQLRRLLSADTEE